MEKLSLIKPDDWHCHFRDENYLSRTVPDAARQFYRAIAMPNLIPPITTVKQAAEYHQRILEKIPDRAQFMPLMTLYLTEHLSQNELKLAKKSGLITACKLYPAGATTHSAAGITQLTKIYPLLACMQEVDLPLLIHGESINPEVDIFDREERFIEDELIPLLKNFPQLRIVLEHISTATAVQFILDAPPQIAATITPHHLWYNRNFIFKGGLRPHYYCLPILKRRTDQEALLKAATSGHSKFFLGTDSAPHAQAKKESACGCAGVYNAFSAIELYAQIFEQEQALNQLEKFSSINGPKFYGLPINETTITLVKSPWEIPTQLPFGNETVIPMLAGETLNWRLTSSEKV